MTVENVTLPNGYVVKGVPEDVSKAELKKTALANGWATEADFPPDLPVSPTAEAKGPPASPQLQEGRGFITDQAIRGFGDMVSNLLPDWVEQDLLDLDMKDYAITDELTGELKGFDTKRFETDRAAARDAEAADKLGYEGVEAASTTQRVLGQTARELVSEGPLALVGSTKKIGSVAGEALFSVAQTATGVLAADAVHQANKKWELPPMVEEMLASVIAGVATTGTSVARGATNSMFEAGSEMVANRKRVNESVDKATDYMVSSEMATVIDKATKAQPEIESVIATAQSLENQIPGLIVPPASALADNPIYRKNTEHLLRTDPNFYAEAKAAIDTAKQTIEARKEQLFGKADQATDAEIRSRLPRGYGQKIKQADDRLAKIDDQITQLVDVVTPKTDSVGVGQAIDKLMTRKVKEVQAKLSPQYERLLSQAERSATQMAPEGVGKVHQAVQLMKFKDNFASFPELVNKIERFWAPVDENMRPVFLDPNGNPVYKPKGDISYPEVSANEVDSLKRAINKAQRSTQDPDKQRMLQHAKKTLQESIRESMPEAFAREYQGLDAQYYQELGIPLSSEGVKQLDSTRFAETAGNYLAKPEQAADFINFVGPENGVPVVRDAVLARMNKAAIKKDGSIDYQNLNKFLRQNQRLIDTVPGLRQEIGDTARAVQRLGEDKARLDADYTNRSKELTDGFYKAMNNKRLSGVVNEILNSPAKSDQYFRDIKNFDPESAKMMRQGIRAGILENGMANNGMSMTDFVANNKNVFDKWFGSTYAEDVRYIAAAADIMSKLDIDKMRFATDFRDQDQLTDRFGISAVQLQSVIRDRIAGMGTKMAIIGSKVHTSKVQAKRDKAMKELLMDPEALKTIRESVEGNRITITQPEMVEKLVNKLMQSITKGVVLSMEGAEGELEQLNQQEETQP